MSVQKVSPLLYIKSHPEIPGPKRKEKPEHRKTHINKLKERDMSLVVLTNAFAQQW